MPRHEHREIIGRFRGVMEEVEHEFEEAEQCAGSKAPTVEIREMIRTFQDKMIGLLSELSGMAQEMALDFPRAKRTDEKKGEDFIPRLLERFVSSHRKNFPDAPAEIPTMYELIDRTIETQWKLLECIFFRLPFSVYRDTIGPQGIIEGEEDTGEGIEPPRSGKKIEVLRRVLGAIGMNWSTLEGAVEQLRSGQMRSYPYHLLYLPSLDRTVVISDEVGEKTYVYKGILPPHQFEWAMKGKAIDGHSCKGIHFDSNYEVKLQKALTSDWKEEKEIVITEEVRTEKGASFSPELIEKHGLENLLTWHLQLVSSAPELAEAGIIYDNGIWYFEDAKGDKSWPQIGGRSLASFPNGPFNKAHGLGNERGKLENRNQLRTMFQTLGLRVAAEEEERKRWANMLIASVSDLAEAGIIFENGIWYFGDAKGSNKWPQIGGRSLGCFPNCTFNKAHGLGTDRGMLPNPHNLRAMFGVIGLLVATEEEERKRWANMFISAVPELAEVDIIYENGIWYFGDAKGMLNWPQIGGRSLRCFPNCTFNKAHELGIDEGKLHNPNHLRAMFQTLGLRVATEEEEKARESGALKALIPVWRKDIEDAGSDLTEAGIIFENGIWYFGDAKGMQSWPQIGGKSLMSFPNQPFNKAHGLGNAVGQLNNPNHLRMMFQTLGLRVEMEGEEKTRWANMLISAVPELAESDIIYENGIWYFGDAKGMQSWPQIGGKSLRCFPNCPFNKAHGLGSERGKLENRNHLRSLFQALGLRVATEEEERLKKLKG